MACSEVLVLVAAAFVRRYLIHGTGGDHRLHGHRQQRRSQCQCNDTNHLCQHAGGHLCWRMYAASGHSGSQLHAANAGSECRCFHRLCADTVYVGTNHTEWDIQGCGRKPPSVCRQSDGLRALCQYIRQRSPVRRRDGSHQCLWSNPDDQRRRYGHHHWCRWCLVLAQRHRASRHGLIDHRFRGSHTSPELGGLRLGNLLSWWEEYHSHQFAQHDLWRSGIRRWLPGEQCHH